MNHLQIRLLGKFHVQIGAHVQDKLDAHKTEELLCYLLVHRREQHSREMLGDLLCRDCPVAQTKKTLRQLLWRLQSVLDTSTEVEHCPLLLVDWNWVQLNPDYELWLDVDVFERASALVEDRSGEELDSELFDLLRRAVDLYRGDLLVGWYEDWCLYERERLQNIYLGMLDKLMGYCEAHQKYDSGVSYGERALRYDRASERTYQHLMRLHYGAGARGTAMRQYERCVTALEQELGVKPSRKTVILYEQIRADGLASSPVPHASTELRYQSSDELLTRLEWIEVTLAEIHARVQTELRAVKLALGLQA